MAAEAMRGTVILGDPGAVWRGAAIDSRHVAGDEIFFALAGQRADGHAFAPQAIENGAGTVVVHREVDWGGHAPRAAIRVTDTYQALHDLTRAVRRHVPQHLVAVTGSIGKTTTKELLATMLESRHQVARSQGNLNNLFGFPLSLLNIPDDCEWMVAEMGMSTPGELRQLSLLGQPDVAVFTNIRPAHLENFTSLQDLAEAKAELLAGLSKSGVIVANADDPEVMRIATRHSDKSPSVSMVTYGFGSAADVRASRPEPREQGLGCRFTVSVGDESQLFELQVYGLYNAANCLCAATAAYMLGVPLSVAAQAATRFQPSKMRGELHSLGDDVLLVDDSYNSSPEAARQALESARLLPGKRHLAVLGEMLELGPDAAQFHRGLGERAAALGFSPIVGVGELARELTRAAQLSGSLVQWFDSAATAARWLVTELHPGDVILVKGSRGVGLETVVQALLAEEAD